MCPTSQPRNRSACSTTRRASLRNSIGPGRLPSSCRCAGTQPSPASSPPDSTASPFACPPIRQCRRCCEQRAGRIRSEEHTSELQSLMRISYAVFCLKKKKKRTTNIQNILKINHIHTTNIYTKKEHNISNES